MTLSFNERDQTFFLVTDDAASAKEAGLALSRNVRGANGERIWCTTDYDGKPANNPYAVLQFAGEADSAAAARLATLRSDYERSFAVAPSQHFAAPAPPGREYLPYQLAGIEYALDVPGCLIGDEPGLGKTIQAIGLANAAEARRVLVVCPAAVRPHWQRTVRDWSTLPDVTTYPILKASSGVNLSANYVITSYDLVRNKGIHGALCSREWDLIVLDEGHYLKSTDAVRTRAVFGGGESTPFNRDWLHEHGRRTLALTGTPLPNRPRECYTLTRGLCWDAIDWMSYDKFCYRYNPSRRMRSGHVREEVGRLPELRARLRTNFMVRRLKEDVLPDLPDKRYEMSYVEPNGAIRDALAHERLLDFDPDEIFRPDFVLDGEVATVRREMGEAKVPRVVEHVRYLLDVVEVPKLVLFSHHRSVMAMLLEALGRYGVAEVRGGLTPKARQEAIDRFIVDPRVRVFSAQLTAGGTGIDGLQRVASRVVFAEPDWTPGVNEQAVDRCHRIGQGDNVVAEFLVAEGSMDEMVLNAMLGKVRTVFEALDGAVG